MTMNPNQFELNLKSLNEYYEGTNEGNLEGGPVDDAYLQEGEWEVDIAGNIYPAEVSLRPMYDPGMKKVRA